MVKRRIRTIKGTINYPVGEYMNYNLPIIKSMYKSLKKLFPKDNLTLYCAGSSGAIISGVLASMFKDRKVIIAFVRKSKEKSHGDYYLPLEKDSKAIIVDDFIASGLTIYNIYEGFHKHNPSLEIDCLCVSGVMDERALPFKPRFIIHGTRGF